MPTENHIQLGVFFPYSLVIMSLCNILIYKKKVKSTLIWPRNIYDFHVQVKKKKNWGGRITFHYITFSTVRIFYYVNINFYYKKIPIT